MIGSLYAWLLRRMSCPKHEPRQYPRYEYPNAANVRRYKPVTYVDGVWE